MLLGNLVHSFDINRPRALARRFIRDHSFESYPKICFRIPDYYHDLITSMYSVTHSFIHDNRDVSCLPVVERQLVVRHGYNNIAMFCGPVVARHLHLLENKGFVNALDLTFGVRNRRCSEYIALKLDHDPYFIILVMAIYIFSSSSYTNFDLQSLSISNDESSALTLFRIQNAYAETAWKYLIYRYPWEDVIQRFSNLIRCFIMAQDSLSLMENDREHEEILESFITETD